MKKYYDIEKAERMQKNLRALLVASGLSQTEFGEMVGWHKGHVSRYICGTQQLSWITYLAFRKIFEDRMNELYERGDRYMSGCIRVIFDCIVDQEIDFKDLGDAEHIMYKDVLQWNELVRKKTRS